LAACSGVFPSSSAIAWSDMPSPSKITYFIEKVPFVPVFLITS
jgi:hypothetical protein